MNKPKLPNIETFRNENSDRDFVVTFESHFLSFLYLSDGREVRASVELQYTPDRVCADPESLEAYLMGYRNLRMRNEEVANRIMEDFVEVTQPREAVLTVEFTNHGNVVTTVVVGVKKGEE